MANKNKNLQVLLNLSTLLLMSVLFTSLSPTHASQKQQQVKTPAYEILMSRILLGMSYPSGNIYLRPFHPGFTAGKRGYSVRKNNREVLIYPFKYDDRYNKKTVQKLYAGHVLRVIRKVYIPGVEGYDDEHNKHCKWKYKRTRIKQGEYVSDFYQTNMLHCEYSEQSILYKTARSPLMHNFVIAFDKTLEPTKVDTSVFGKPRTATKAELALVAKEKARIAKIKDDCTTEKNYITDAKQRLIAHFKNSKYRVRLSIYADPGCYGHMGNIWLLDVMEKNRVVKTYRMVHYVGVF